MAPGGSFPPQPLEALAAITALFSTTASLCIPSNFVEDYIGASQLDQFKFSGPNCGFNCTSNRQWIYQSCQQFGYFQTTAETTGDPTTNISPSNSKTSPFIAFASLNATTAGAYVCEASFNLTSGSYTGPSSASSSGILEANIRYGARNVEGGNITMPNGSLDPWHALSVINGSDFFFESGSPQETAASVTVVELIGTGHCRDMYAPSAFESVGINDTSSVVWAHNVIAKEVAKYVGQADLSPTPAPHAITAEPTPSPSKDTKHSSSSDLLKAMPTWAVIVVSAFLGAVVAAALFSSGRNRKEQEAVETEQISQRQSSNGGINSARVVDWQQVNGTEQPSEDESSTANPILPTQQGDLQDALLQPQHAV
jgi:hypothetical protein